MGRELKKPLVFVHVEKAGGITIHNMFHHFIPEYITPKPDFGPYFLKKHLQQIQKWYPLKIKGIGGHRINARESYFEEQFVCSIVREPMARTLSHLNWQITKMGIEHDFASFVQNPYFKNFQTFRLTGQRDYHRAMEIIDKNYSFIGILEKFDQTVAILSEELFGDSDYLLYEKMNTTAKEEKIYQLADLSETQLQILRECNEVDLLVYEQLKKRFTENYPEENYKLVREKAQLQSPLKTKFKRKASNLFIGRVIQPLIQEKTEYGY